MLSAEVIALLRCPVTGQALRPATEEEKGRHGLPVKAPALITADGSRIYRSEMELPILLSANEETLTG